MRLSVMAYFVSMLYACTVSLTFGNMNLQLYHESLPVYCMPNLNLQRFSAQTTEYKYSALGQPRENSTCNVQGPNVSWSVHLLLYWLILITSDGLLFCNFINGEHPCCSMSLLYRDGSVISERGFKCAFQSPDSWAKQEFVAEIVSFHQNHDFAYFRPKM